MPSIVIKEVEALDGHDDNDDGMLNEVEITIAIRAVLIIYVDFVVRCPEAKPEPEIEWSLAYDGTSEEYRGRIKPEQTLVTKENKYEDACYAWAAEDWSEYSKCKPACGLSSQARTRNVKCRLKPEYVMGVPESILYSDKCTGNKPAATEDRKCNDFSKEGCTDDQCYWETGDWSNYTTPAGCGKVNRTRSRSVQCMKNGKKADESCCEKCDKASDDAKKTGKVKPMSVQNELIESVQGCKYEWKAGEWGPWLSLPACGKAQDERARKVTCVEKNGGHLEDAAKCDADTRPKETEERDSPRENYVACAYEWENGTWSDWQPSETSLYENHCELKTLQKRQRPVRCMRFDPESKKDTLAPADARDCHENIRDEGRKVPARSEAKERNMRAEFFGEKREVKGCSCEVYVAR